MKARPVTGRRRTATAKKKKNLDDATQVLSSVSSREHFAREAHDHWMDGGRRLGRGGEREREREGKADSLIDNGKRGRIKEDRCRQTERERENSAASEVATAPAAHATRKVSRSQEIRTCAKISAEHTQEEKGGARREG